MKALLIAALLGLSATAMANDYRRIVSEDLCRLETPAGSLRFDLCAMGFEAFFEITREQAFFHSQPSMIYSVSVANYDSKLIAEKMVKVFAIRGYNLKENQSVETLEIKLKQVTVSEFAHVLEQFFNNRSIF